MSVIFPADIWTARDTEDLMGGYIIPGIPSSFDLSWNEMISTPLKSHCPHTAVNDKGSLVSVFSPVLPSEQSASQTHTRRHLNFWETKFVPDSALQILQLCVILVNVGMQGAEEACPGNLDPCQCLRKAGNDWADLAVDEMALLVSDLEGFQPRCWVRGWRAPSLLHSPRNFRTTCWAPPGAKGAQGPPGRSHTHSPCASTAPAQVAFLWQGHEAGWRDSGVPSNELAPQACAEWK